MDETEKRDTAVNQKKKLEIFHDPPVEELSSSKNEKPPENSITNDPAFITVTGNNKVKHSMKSRKPKKNKGSVDESMPCTQSTESVDFNRPRRTRGKTVDYRLPSLRAKMRRPTEKLVDATTTVNIQDLQVKYKKSKKVLEKELKTDMKAMKSLKMKKHLSLGLFSKRFPETMKVGPVVPIAPVVSMRNAHTTTVIAKI